MLFKVLNSQDWVALTSIISTAHIFNIVRADYAVLFTDSSFWRKTTLKRCQMNACFAIELPYINIRTLMRILKVLQIGA